jgi:hypothetical protein
MVRENARRPADMRELLAPWALAAWRADRVILARRARRGCQPGAASRPDALPDVWVMAVCLLARACGGPHALRRGYRSSMAGDG